MQCDFTSEAIVAVIDFNRIVSLVESRLQFGGDVSVVFSRERVSGLPRSNLSREQRDLLHFR